MLDLLDANFVNAWILQKDLDALASDHNADEALRAMAKQVNANSIKHRLMPVGIHVMSPTGELLAKASVNEDLLMGRGSQKKYVAVLQDGLDAMKAAAAAGEVGR